MFPEWISEVEPKGLDKDLLPEGEKVKTISYPHDFNAYLIEAIKEQQKQIEALKSDIANLKALLNR